MEKFDGHYALDSRGIFKDLYNKDTELLHDVEDWIVVANGRNLVWVYVLKRMVRFGADRKCQRKKKVILLQRSWNRRTFLCAEYNEGV